MGAAGAGAGTSLSLFAGLAIWAALSLRHASGSGFLAEISQGAALQQT